MLSYSSNGLADAATLVSGKDFNCNATICYGIGAVHQTMLKLQALINKYATSAGFKAISVDGKIGDGTTVAFWRVVDWINARGGTGAKMTINGLNAKSMDNFQIAKNANQVIQTLEFWATSLPKAPPATPARPPASSAPVPSTPSGPSSAPAVPSGPNSIAWPIQIPDFSQSPSGGSFGPGQLPAASSSRPPIVVTQQEAAPWWLWAAGGAILVGGVVTAVVVMRPKKGPNGTAKIQRRRAASRA